jgi:phosphatidate cytidylyltransferase
LNNFFRRTLTGAWIVVFVMAGFWIHPISFFITGLIMLAGTQYEYYTMIRGTGIKPQTIAGIIAGIILYSVSTLVASHSVPGNFFLVMLPVIFIIILIELYRKEEKPFDSLAHTFFAILYCAVPFSVFPFAAFSQPGINSLLPHGNISFSPGIVLGFFILLWANDTGAYLAGISFGNHRLMERISPKKSWEGFFGGLIAASLVALLISGWLGVIGKMHWINIAIIISLAGTYGDLAESMLKRSAGVKDSGSVLPGHGGFLDRFDSTIMSFPLVYLFILLFG